ncbi:hypothetical protein KY284_020626 [Solanum tuberosum]|nr:hypothetical protein KY284_020626 [Solanum tuberosum]
MDGLAETGSSSSSSSSLWPCTYDVFLSFRGEDVRKNFVDHLYTALQQRGIHTFKDDEKLERGKSISPSLFKAIEESMISIIIFSQNYASSSWCLDELVKITQCMKLRGQIVLPVFYDVDPSVVRKQKANVGEFFAKHELDFKDDEERVKRWRTAMTEAANVSGWDLPNIANGHESKCIEQIVECVMEILDHSASDATENLVGIRSRMGTVYSLLNLESDKVQFVGIWGMSGIGKTTIARAIYDKIFRYFQGRIVMHQLIQEMGWYIVRKEASNNLGKYTRLWSPDDILHVLSENPGTEAVEGIWLHLPIPKDINVGAEAFKYTDNLRLLKMHNASVSVAPDCLPNKLIWLHWHGYPMKSLPAGILTNYKMLQRISFTNCVGLLENQQMHDMATSLWLHLFKKCIVKSGHFSIYLPGEQVPEWFGYKLNGTSVSMQLPNDWYNDKFMGFAICVVSDLETTWLSVHEGYLQEMPGISIEFTIKSHLRRSTSCLMNIGFVGTNKNVASDHTCLAYVPFEDYWSMYKNHIDSPNNWYQIDFSANSLRKHIFLKSWGIRLVYTDDLQIFTS